MAGFLFEGLADTRGVIARRKEEAEEYINQLASEEISSEELTSQLDRRFQLDVPVLGTAFQLDPEDISLDADKTDVQKILDLVGTNTVKGRGTRFTVKIPFTGDGDLFSHGPSGSNAKIPGYVQGKHVVLERVVTDPDQTQLQKEFKNQVSEIEKAIRFMGEIATAGNKEISKLIRDMLANRLDRIRKAKDIDLGFPKG